MSEQREQLRQKLKEARETVRKLNRATSLAGVGRDYESHRQSMAEASRERSLAGRDIGEIPEVQDKERRQRCERDFKQFCESYFPLVFSLKWSADHLKVIAKIEDAVLRGGLFAVAMPRGSGKSTLCECACIWSVLYGHHSFVCLIGSDESIASDMLDSIKSEIENNDLLNEDFPEITYPIRKLEGILNRCNGQLHKGDRTHITWIAKEIVLPTIAGSKGSGAIVKVAGITGRIRGMKFKRPDGCSVRPTLVIIDDPQTDESARSFSQNASREAVLAGAILGLAGPGVKISGIMPCTVIAPGDMADSILSRDKHPEWNGERTKLLYQFPTNMDLWKQYAEILAESLRNDRRGEEATEFYSQRREEMDSGAVVAWAERFNDDELSAVQNAMNIYFRDRPAFMAEYQNDPIVKTASSYSEELTADAVAGRVVQLERLMLPRGTTRLTLGVDVGAERLHYTLTAWDQSFSGVVVDYGIFPGETRELKDVFPDLSEGPRVYAGLSKLVDQLCTRVYYRDVDKTTFQICQGLIDSGWRSEEVYTFCRQSKYKSILLPSKGRSIKAGNLAMSDWKPRAGEIAGYAWRKGITADSKVWLVMFDANMWKSFLIERLQTPFGSPGSLGLYGERPVDHYEFAKHITAEYRVKTAGRGRELDEWFQRPNVPNHWLDSTVLSTVAASVHGLQWSAAVASGSPQSSAATRKKVRLSDVQKQKRGQNG